MAGGLEAGDADALSEAFEVIARLRFEHHAQLISEGRPADNLIDPGTLDSDRAHRTARGAAGGQPRPEAPIALNP